HDPMSFGPESSPIVPPLRRGLTDVFGHQMASPEGRVPLRRITLSQLARLGKLDNFFRKDPGRKFDLPSGKGKKPKQAKGSAKTKPGRRKSAAPRITGSAGETHRHALCQDSSGGPYFGCSHFLNVWDVDPSPGVFNLSQLWMVGRLGGQKVQTIESGWQVY